MSTNNVKIKAKILLKVTASASQMFHANSLTVCELKAKIFLSENTMHNHRLLTFANSFKPKEINTLKTNIKIY